MNSVCTHSLDNLTQSYVFIYCLYVDNSQMSVSNPDFFPKSWTHISSCLLDISTWMSSRYLKHVCPKLTSHCSPHPIYSSCSVFHLADGSSILLLVQNVGVILDFSLSVPISNLSGDLLAVPSKHLESEHYGPPPFRSELLILLTKMTIASLLTGLLLQFLFRIADRMIF